ncbi:MAG: hypothetical protein GTO45_08570 [Candidatus Aminicenantes bacterium]|nr:hypothetical protein [Candidatus Aminicenantes bacterium]NIM78885.1 hypothetical protein [Candidatus Aminicenantes bacterium]NIN18141.1 hypothetical protein [Candidatus Aminicenantes bacterium]NIN42040.1 hypothetical protein [Candidatus Aminicenantes bacterium]NIN84796.1 hypothetical protein [Candidatus Aminicenantes bacterium]
MKQLLKLKFKPLAITWIVLSLLWLGNMGLAAEETVLTFKEMKPNKKKSIVIDPSPDTVSIVDINSKVLISVNRKVVWEKAVEFAGIKDPQKHLDDIAHLTELLNKEADILALMKADKGLTKEQREKKLDEFSRKMKDLLKFLMEDDTYRDLVNKAFEAEAEADTESYDMAYRQIFVLVGRRLRELSQNLENIYAGVNFRMGGWLVRKPAGKDPVHIEGFDTIEEGEFYQYPSFTMPTTEEARKKFNEFKNAADRFEEGGFKALLNVEENIKRLNDLMVAELKNVVDCWRNAITTIRDTIIQEGKDLQFPKTKTFQAKVEDLMKIIKDLRDASEILEKSPADLVTHIQVMNDIRELIANLKTTVDYFLDNFAVMETEIRENLKKLTAKAKAVLREQLDNIHKNCYTGLKNLAEGIVKETTSFLSQFNKGFYMLDEHAKAALELGDKVDSFMINEIPETGILDLRRTGTRKEGDSIYVKAVFEKKPAGETKPFVIGDKTLVLYKIVSINVKLGMIFADPFKNEGLALTRKFQAAPSYSVLLKIGNRKSLIYNQFIRLSFGLNVAALDFNQDSNYELGLGVVISAFKDYLQFGVGRNMQFDRWYWFFGIQLPWGSITVPTTSGGATPE